MALWNSTQLRYFLKIAEHGSFTRAAEELGVSQPALSQQVAKLEAELGRPVFDRLGRSVRLTEAGRLLRRRAERLLALADDTARELRDDGETGRVVVAAIPTIAPFLLPPVLRAFRERLSRGRRVQVDEEVTEALLRRCRAGRGRRRGLRPAGRGPAGPGGRAALRRGAGPGPARRPPAGGPRDAVPMDAIRGEPFVLLGEGHCLSDQIRSFCQQRSVQPIATGRTGQLATVQELVALGHGDLVHPRDGPPGRRQPAPGLPLDRRRSRPGAPIAACWNPDRYQSRLAAALLEALRAERPVPQATAS